MTDLVRFADALFGPSTRPDPLGRRWIGRYLALALVLALLVFARRPDALLRPQFWAEDGTIFFSQQVRLGFWRALLTLYAGFPFLPQRCVAALAAVVPTAAVPLAYNASAIAVTALTMATFALPHFRHRVRSDVVRIAVCLATVCMPAGQELLATPTTMGYFLAIWLLYLSVMRGPRSRAGTVVWCVGGAVSVLSVPLAVVVAPLWALRALRGVVRRDGRDLAFAATQAVALLVVVALTQRLPTETALSRGQQAFAFQPAQVWSALGALGWILAACVDSTFLPRAVIDRLESNGTIAMVAPALTVAVAAAYALRRVDKRGRITVGLALYVFVSSLWLVLAGRPIIVALVQGRVPNLSMHTFQALGTRHRALANAALLLVAAGIVDGARDARVRAAVAAVACAGLAFAWAPEFRIPPFPDRQWPIWAARLDAKLASGSREPLVIPSHPALFDIPFDAPAPSSRPLVPANAGD